MNKLQRELESELGKAREERAAAERRLDEQDTQHKKLVMALRDQQQEALDSLRKEKVGNFPAACNNHTFTNWNLFIVDTIW